MSTSNPINGMLHKTMMLNVILGIAVIVASVIFSIATTKASVEKDIAYLQKEYTTVTDNTAKSDMKMTKIEEQYRQDNKEIKDDISSIKTDIAKLMTKVDLLLDR